MKTLQLKDNFYWTGILDHNLRVFDIIMETEFGTTYNSYLLKGSEKTVLFETAKAKFFDDYLNELEQIIDIASIDYIVVNHTEPDHAGSIEKLVALNPNIKIVGTSVAINFLKEIVNHDFYSIAVKDNDTLSLGDKTLRFMVVPYLHWPDTMYTYVEEDKTLITCDSFGSHYCLDDILLSKVTQWDDYWKATKYYFDNIIGPFKPYMSKALKRVKDIEFDMICTGHGPVIDSHIDELITTYEEWCTVVNPNTKKTVVIPYVSAYGYTKELAETITKGIEDSGDIEVRAYDLVETPSDQVLGEIGFADGILFGTPTIIGEALKPIWDLTTSMFSPIHKGKVASAFGSYGWSGEGVPNIMARLEQLRLKTVDGFRIKFKPGENDLSEAYDYGYNFGCVLLNKENPRTASARKSLVKCLVCGEIFEEGTEICPVCGVGKENFVLVDEELINVQKDTQEKFLILGNGTAGLNAATAIRERNKTCSIIMVSNESVLSYNRPMLTKSLLAAFDAKQIAVNDEKWYEEKNIINLLDKTVASLKPEEKEVVFSDGMVLQYDKCIYALGAECFIPPIPGADKPEVIAIRNIEDSRKIGHLLPNVKNAVVIGGGVLGLEAAWELSKAKCKVTVLELADKLMGRQLDEGAGKVLENIIVKNGIDIKLNVKIDRIAGGDSVTGVQLQGGETIPADLVIMSCGVRANTSIAKDAGIEIDRAIVVNEKMETNLSDVYACGDCAQFEGINYAIWPEATQMGKIAGANAAGDELAYETVAGALTFNAMNTSLFAVGDNGKNPDMKYKTLEIKDPVKNTYETYYFSKNRLTGAILIGNLKKLASVQQAVEDGTPFTKMFQ